MDERNEEEDNERSDVITKMLNLNSHMSKPKKDIEDGPNLLKSAGPLKFASKNNILKNLKKNAGVGRPSLRKKSTHKKIL